MDQSTSTTVRTYLVPKSHGRFDSFKQFFAIFHAIGTIAFATNEV